MCAQESTHSAECVVVTVAFEFPYNCSVQSIVDEVEREIRRHLFTYRFRVLGATVEQRQEGRTDAV